MATKKTLRAVGEDERPEPPAEPKTLAEAVDSGDVLEMLLAQRRLMAAALVDAAENTRPQFNNEMNKLHALIREEESRRKAAREEATESDNVADEAFDASAV